MRALGTILPTREIMDAGDRHAERQYAVALAAAEKELVGCDRRVVGGEVRYYRSPTLYTPAVQRSKVRRWFETREDGDYAIPNK